MSTPMLANVSAQLGLNAPGQNPLLPFPVPSQPPVLLAAVPVSGPTTGGNAVLLIGLGLDNVTSVSFGGTPAVVISQNLLGLLVAVSAPAHAAGTVPVTVTTPVGTSNAVNYTYVSPVLPRPSRRSPRYPVRSPEARPSRSPAPT